MQACVYPPYYHKMESGSPHARYAILEKCNDKLSVAFHKVAYNWEKAAEVALANNRSDWVNALTAGRME